MPESLRFDVYEDLPETVRGEAIALMERIVALQQEWIAGRREGAYGEWKAALIEIDELLRPFRSDLLEDQPSTR
jgi:hypothetical protein